VEQARALARARPEWTLAICQFDLSRSRVPWRPWQWPGFLRTWASTPRLVHKIEASGLHTYTVWAPFLPRFGVHTRWQASADGLRAQARMALRAFIATAGRPDLIHALAVYPGAVAAVGLGREFGLPVGLTEHLGPFPPPTLCERNGSPMPIVQDTYRNVQAVSAVSHALASRIESLQLAHTVQVLPNFIDEGFGTLAPAAQPSCEEFSLLSVGGPSHAKGTDVLLQAFALLPGSVRLTVVGQSAELPFFQRMARSLGVADRVRWPGALPHDQVSAAYRAADVFVLPSRGETFGMVLIEALANGKPLIATRCGGPDDIVHAGNGLLVPVDDAQALAAAMKQMRNAYRSFDPGALRADALSRFGVASVACRFESWYRGRLDGRNMIVNR